MSRKMKRASTLPAALEALAGHNGKLSNISCLTRSRCCLTHSSSRRGQFLQPEENEEEQSQHQNGDSSSQPQNVAHDRAVFSGCGIVVIAVEQHLIDGVADLALRGFHQSHA